jgi:hypothetical protein
LATEILQKMLQVKAEKGWIKVDYVAPSWQIAPFLQSGVFVSPLRSVALHFV